MAGERLADSQRGQDGAVRELRVSVDRLVRQADLVAASRAWWTRQVATWAVVLALVLAAGIALAWRAHAVAQSTHDILQQILENQTKAKAAKGGKPR
jgi:type VI protein secretion system component VasF